MNHEFNVNNFKLHKIDIKNTFLIKGLSDRCLSLNLIESFGCETRFILNRFLKMQINSLYSSFCLKAI